MSGLADDVVVLDSGSRDDTEAIARAHGARFLVEPFRGYGPQKAAAVAHAAHDWVLLLDADEHLTDQGRAAIEHEMCEPRADGFRLPRQEWLFWRWPHPSTRPNWQLRLFRRARGRMNDVPVHAAPVIDGTPLDLDAPFRHYGEPDLAARVDKINRYSSGLLAKKKKPRLMALRLLLYPGFAFLKLYVGKRYFLNGWAGFFAAKTQSFYAFLKYAKRYEETQGRQR